MIVNINDQVKVRLTDAGHQCWHDFWTKEVKRTFLLPAPDAQGRYTFNIWTLMQVFGPSTYHGQPKMFFVDNQIEILEDDTALKHGQTEG